MRKEKFGKHQISIITNNLDLSYLDLLKTVMFQPIFIMGDHRSGTTLLHKILAATKCFNFVRAYHIMKYNEIIFNYVNRIENKANKEVEQILQSLNIKNRGIDNVAPTPDLPKEYGSILKNAGYRESLNPENLSFFMELCKKIQFVSNPNNPLLLKNPFNFAQFMYVKSALPETKFIFIHRHPINVINSKLRAIRSLLSSRNDYIALMDRQYTNMFDNPLQRYFYRFLYSSYFDLGLRRIVQATVESRNYFLENIGLLPKTDYVSVNYEDLCKAPEITILKILDFLGLEPKVNLDYDSLIELRPLKLLPEVERNYEKICQKLKPYLTYHGYSD